MKTKSIFVSEGRIRAGWRLLIWLAIVLSASGLVNLVVLLFRPANHAFLDPGRLIVGDLLNTFLPTLLATYIMANVEGCTWGDYYIPARAAFGKQFWWGVVWGLGAVSLLIGMIAAFGGYRITGIAIVGTPLIYWTTLWLLASLMIGVAEEFFFRVYMLRTLADGIGFWPAAVLLSIGFGAIHYFEKPYERWEDFAATGLLGLFMCLTIRRTGTIAFAMGWHAAFDWGAIYFYSGRNAGEFAVGHLLQTVWAGSDRLTGGLLGPEASWFVFVVTALLFAAFALIYRERRSEVAAAVTVQRGSS